MKRRFSLLYTCDHNVDRVVTEAGAVVLVEAGTQDPKRKESDYMKTKEKIPVKARQPNNNVEESTYALLVRSEDKKRALLETIIYGLWSF